MRWRLKPEHQVVLLGYQSDVRIGMQVLEGRDRANTREVKERAGYVVAIGIGLGILYEENVHAENDWLRCRREILNDRAPLDLMLGGRMSDLIAVNRLVERERGL